MINNHYCTRDQYKRLCELGLKIGNVNTKQISCGELLDLLPQIAIVHNSTYFLQIHKQKSLWQMYYHPPTYGTISEWKGLPESIEDHESLAQLAADCLIWLLKEEIIKPENLTA